MTRKVSDIIEMAYQSDKYLTNEVWLCSVLKNLNIQGSITNIERSNTHNAIDNALGSCAFLKAKLIAEGILNMGVSYNSPEYKEAAHKFWGDLVTKLRSIGK